MTLWHRHCKDIMRKSIFFPKNEMKKKLIRIGIIIVFIFLAVFALLHLSLVQREVRRYAVSLVQKKLGLKVSIRNLDFNLLSLRISIDDVVIHDKSKSDLPPFLKADNIQAKVPLSLLIRGNLELRELSASHLRVIIHKSRDGRTNVPGFGSTPKKKEKDTPALGLPDFRLGKMILSDASIVYTDLRNEIILELPIIDMSLRWMEEQKHEFYVTGRQKGTAKYGEFRRPIQGLTVKGILGHDFLEIQDFQLILERSKIELAGMVRNLLSPSLDLDAEVNIDLESIRSLLFIPADFSGGLAARASLEGSVQSLQTNLRIQTQNMRLGQFGDASLEADIKWKDRLLEVESLRVEVAGGRITGRGELHPLDWEKGNHARMEWQNLDLSLLSHLSDDIPPFASRAWGNATAQWTEPSWEGLAGEVDLEIRKEVPADTDGTALPVLWGRAHAEAEPEQVSVRIPELLTENMTLSGTLLIRGTKLSGQYRLELKDIQSIGFRYFPSSIMENVPDLDGKAVISGRINGTTREPRVSSIWEGSGISFFGLAGFELAGEAEWENNILHMEYFRLTSGNTVLNLWGKFPLDSKNGQPAIEYSLRGLSLKSLSDFFGLDGELGGQLELNGKVREIQPFPRLSGQGRAVALRYAGWELEEIRLEYGIGERKLDFEASSNSPSFSLKGFVGLAPPFPFDASLEVKGAALSKIRPVLSGFSLDEAAGELTARFDFMGEIENLARMEISGDAEVTAGSLAFRNPPFILQDIRFQVSLDQGQIVIKPSSLRLDEARVEVEGRLPLSFFLENQASSAKAPINALRVSVRYSELDPFRVASVLGAELPPELSGRINGKVEVRMPALEADLIDVRADIETFDLDLWGIPLSLESARSLRWQSGRLAMEEMNFTGEDHSFRIGGTLDFNASEFESLNLEGNIDVRIFQVFSDQAAYSGAGRYRIRIEGPFTDPILTGILNLTDIDAEFVDPDLYFSGLSGEIQFSRNQITITGLEGRLNGGNIKLEGTLIHDHLALKRAAISFSGSEINMDYPSGLRSLIDTRLKLESDGERHSLEGSVSLLSAEYREPFNVESRLFRLLRTRGRGEILLERNEFLKNLNFNIKIDTINQAKIDNNLTKASARANLRLTGSPYNPGLSGRIEFEEGGEVYLADNTYQIEQATVDFINPNQIVPDIGLRARTRASGYLIQLLVFGTPDDLSARLVSDPPLAESDIVSILLTGKRLEYVSSSLLDVVSHQAVDYLEGAVLGKVEKLAERTLGLDSVRIDTSLIATQENPGARITVGQQITSDLDLVFSQGLRRTDERTIILNYHPVKNLNLRGMKQDNDAYQFSAMHELRFGLKRDERMGPDYTIERKAGVIEKVEFQGRTGIPEKSIVQRLKLKAGKRFDFFVFQQDLERIQELYLKNDYLEFRLDYQKKEFEGKVILLYRLSAGPRVILRPRGAMISKRTLSGAERLWMEGAFPRKRVEDVQRLVREEFYSRGYYRMEIQVEEDLLSPELKMIYIRVDPREKYDRITYRFEGRRGLPEQSLLSILEKPGSQLSLFSDSRALIDDMESIYRQNGYLKAAVGSPRVDFRTDEKTVDVSFKIQEGPLFSIARIEFPGRTNIGRDSLLRAAGISEGDPFTLKAFYRAQTSLEDRYAGQGFLNTRIQSRIEIDPEGGKVQLIFNIEENKKAVIEEIEIFGNKITDSGVINRELDFVPGQPVDYGKFAAAQKNLYGLGIFHSVDIDSYPSAEKQDRKNNSFVEESYRVEVLVEEIQPYHLRYGAQYNTDTGIGGEAELVRRNFLGKAMDVGGIIQANLREQDARAFFRIPYFLGNKMDSSLFAFITRKEEPDFTTSRAGATLQQQLTIRSQFVISYNYTFEHLRNLFGEIPVPDERYNIGRVSFSISRDRRENIFDALRGNFFSLTGEYAEKILASDVRYLRFFAQYFMYRPLGRSFHYAAAVRVGLGRGLGQDLVPSERFFAGGSSSLRGFGYHEVGPKNPVTGNPQGGDAVFIVNQELRFTVYKLLGGVVFLDVGNVYSAISDLNPLDIRKTAGFGLRLNLGFALARLDLGFKLDRRDDESAFRLHFSLGQAF